MQETITKKIGAHEYRITHLGSKDARSMLVRLGHILGPALGDLMSAGGHTKKAANPLGVGMAISSIFRGLSVEDLEEACRVFGESTEVIVDGIPQRLDLEFQEHHFAGKFGELAEWLEESVQWNYVDFFAYLTSVTNTASVKKEGGKKKTRKRRK